MQKENQRNIKHSTPTIDDVVAYLEQMLEGHRNAFKEQELLRRRAISDLKQANPSRARAILDQDIDACRRTMKDPFWSYPAGSEPSEAGAAGRLQTLAQEKLTKLEALRTAVK